MVLDQLRVPIKAAANPHLVPRTAAGLERRRRQLGRLLEEYRSGRLHSQEALAHLHWMLQKDTVGQDMVLVGRPNASDFRRELALRFCEVTEREMEYVALSRDTLEADLKQRREIVVSSHSDSSSTPSSSSAFVDQAVVRAAVHGRVLVLDGLELTERNVLPLLNNLLENREMHLEDGRFLTSAQRYDHLLQSAGYSHAHLQRLGLVRSSEAFRVVALASPAPPYPGNPLDPPLRSRFQARNVESLPASSLSSLLAHPLVPRLAVLKDSLSMLSASSADSSSFSASVSLDRNSAAPVDLPDCLPAALCDLLSFFPSLPATAFERFYPYPLLFASDPIRAQSIRAHVQRLFSASSPPTGSKSLQVERKTALTAEWSASDCSSPTPVELPCGGRHVGQLPQGFVATAAAGQLLNDMLQDHACGRDLCLLRPRGTAKTATVLAFASLLGYEVETFAMYKDLTHRELFQRRVTRADGSTAWENSPLVEAALRGRLCVLDNVHHLTPGALSVLQSLVQQRQASLFDGTRLMPLEEFALLDPAAQHGGRCKPVHPSFRIVALGELPKKHASFLTPDLVNMFSIHAPSPNLPASSDDLRDILLAAHPSVDPQALQTLLHIASALHQDPNLPELSLRQSLRIAKRLAADPSSAASVPDMVSRTLLSAYMPRATQTLLESTLTRFKSKRSSSPSRFSSSSSSSSPSPPSLLATTITPASEDAHHLVPRIDYFRIDSQEALEQRVHQDYLLGEHILLVGQQGVGKNKVVDNFLQKHSLPRQYCQLHRDFTVQALTLQTNIVDGLLVPSPSPLFLAATLGHTLVLDEADKAPTEVVSVLKGLCEGDMRLCDGRRLVSALRRSSYAEDDASVLPIHPSFRMIVLANPPGWPFLGNDFFSHLGDHFAVHVVDNPDFESEVQLLRSYAPDLKQELVRQLATAFRLLRARVEAGKLTYPYSTRECLAIIKHLQRFPDDSVHAAVSNVFAFDAYDPMVRLQILECLAEAGLPVSARSFLTPDALVAEHQGRLQLREEYERSLGGKEASSPKHGKEDPDNTPHVGGNTWAGGTGGRDTAGLGGVGGPYRLDKGHAVHQVPQHEKDAVSEEIRKQARKMAEEELKKRLAEINLDPGESKAYQRYFDSVRAEITQLRALLQGLHGRHQERSWLKHQSAGDLDDNRLIEGIAGEKNIYKRRGDASSSSVLADPHTPLLKRKRIKFVVDCSGSMYRFNGYDGRLERMLEAAVMIMESFDGFDATIQWAISGHSGDSEDVRLSAWDAPPADRKQRFQLLQRMAAHTQYCNSGDHTLEAIYAAVQDVSSADADEHFVVVLSDANLDRYGISAAALYRALSSNEKVRAYCIFVASLFNEAETLKRELPGKAFVCLKAEDLPTTFTHILKQTLA
ncbi:MAG: AAA family ATPase [archaeon]|nr:AAA family ATPase [archaeon]